MARYNPLKPNKPARAPRREPIPAGVVPDPGPVSHEPVLRENDAKDGLELRFPTRPADDVLALFRSTKDLPAEQRWHWHRRMKCWYARRNDTTRAFSAKVLAHGHDAAPVAVPADEVAANLVIARPAALAEALEHTQALDNVIAVSFATAPPAVPVFIPPPRPPLPAWRQRLLNKTT